VKERQAALWPGSWSDLVRRRAAEKTAAEETATVAGGVPPERSPARRPDRQAERQRAKARREVEALEEEVVRLEERVREIDAALADPDVWKDGPRTRELTLARDDARRAVDTRYAAWEEAVKKLEEVPA
jgi:hypothetical protein